MMSTKMKFFTKITIAHVFTYLLCGTIFMMLLDYSEHIELLGMKSMDEISPSMIVIAQIVRGILFGFVIWWVKDSIIGKKLAWMKLWLVLVIVGIINTYGPAHGSIEGMLYLDLTRFGDVPAHMNLSIIEVLAQPLLFSIIVTFQRKKNQA